MRWRGVRRGVRRGAKIVVVELFDTVKYVAMQGTINVRIRKIVQI